MKTSLAALAITMLLSGCNIRHNVARGYPQYLASHMGQSHLPTTSAASSYSITQPTAANRYEFRSVLAGYANVWVVRFGEVLDDTLQSTDVQTAFDRLQKTNDNHPHDGLLIFDLENYTYVNRCAHVELKVTYWRNGKVIINKIYIADGRPEGSKMFWGGAFTMKYATQQSTMQAIDDILRRLIVDLNAARTG